MNNRIIVSREAHKAVKDGLVNMFVLEPEATITEEGLIDLTAAFKALDQGLDVWTPSKERPDCLERRTPLWMYRYSDVKRAAAMAFGIQDPDGMSVSLASRAIPAAFSKAINQGDRQANVQWSEESGWLEIVEYRAAPRLPSGDPGTPFT